MDEIGKIVDMVVNDDDISSDIKSKIFSILINKNIVVKLDDKGIIKK